MEDSRFEEYRDSNGKLICKFDVSGRANQIVRCGIQTTMQYLENGLFEVTERSLPDGSVIKRTVFGKGNQAIGIEKVS